MEEPTGQPSGVAVQGAPRPADASCATDELAALRVALGQLARLLDDAVARLATSFETVADASAAQRGPVRATAAATACDRRIDGGVADAIVALQFHDIASQLLEQIAARVDTVDDLTTGRGARGVRPGAAGRKESGQDRRRSRATQVTQADMLAGTIELF